VSYNQPTANQPHTHTFRTSAHLDGCHWYSTVGACACGATVTATNERDFKGDPYSGIWAEPQYVEVRRDERGRFVKPHWEEVRCQRCDEIRAGAKIKRTLIIAAKDGTIERCDEGEYDQEEPDADDQDEEEWTSLPD
jgi:hypothetical protein